VARLITLVEAESDELPKISAALAPLVGRAHVVGLTGSPGVGKSTTTAALVTEFRARGLRVGVLAVDPTSPFSGGALLGDRIRMGEHTTDPEVFIRSMASRGHLGGLSWATPHAIRVLDAAGCDVVLLETVGVGQSEIEVASMADTSVVLLAPGMGDGIQAAKAGILEIGDIFCINKADREGAATTRRELRSMLSLSTPADGWKRPINLTVASAGTGIAELADDLTAHFDYLKSAGLLATRRTARVRREIQQIALDRVRRRFSFDDGLELDKLASKVAAGTLDPFAAAETLLASTET